MALYEAHPSIPTRVIHLHSEQANQMAQGLTTSCMWNMQTPIKCGDKQMLLLTPINSVIPNVIYDVNNRNNTLNVNLVIADLLGPVYAELTLPIPNGNYNVDTFAQYMQITLQAYAMAGGVQPYAGIAVAYNPRTDKFMFNNPGQFRLIIRATSTARELIGSAGGDIVVPPATLNVLSTSVVNMNSLSSVVYIRSTNLRQYTCGSVSAATQRGLITDSDIILKQGLTAADGFYVFSSETNLQQAVLMIKSLDTIDLRMTDRNNNLVDLNGLHWSISLRVDVIDMK